MPLNGELRALNARLVAETRTSTDYRLYALATTQPAKPGLLRIADGAGACIVVEIWALTPEAFGKFVAAVPPPLSIGTVRLVDGTSAKGFLVEAKAIEGARDITRSGGWRAFMAEQR
jgi:allophanate hydrolase